MVVEHLRGELKWVIVSKLDTLISRGTKRNKLSTINLPPALADIQMTVDAQGGVSGAEMHTEPQLFWRSTASTDDWRDLIADRDKEA